MVNVRRRICVGSLALLASACILAGAARAEESLWQTDFAAAKAKATSEKKLLLVNFTGSDWCGWCIKLKKEVFDEKAFQAEAPKHFVLVELDFPRAKKLSDELKAQNEKLSEEYQVRGFPTILVLDPEGKRIARTGYRPGGPEEYVKHLAEMKTAHEAIVALRGKLEKAQGIERAKLLDQLIDAYAKLDTEAEELEAWTKEIIALDADNKAGLKAKHQFQQALTEAGSLKEDGKFDEAKTVLDKALALSGITGEQKQEAYFAQGECFFHKQDYSGIVACLKKAMEAAPKSPKAETIQRTLDRFAEIADAQEAAAKIKAELEKAQGLDRAKVLDRLVGATEKLAQYLRRGNTAEEIEKWTEEIVALDAENKAGLKRKYEFRLLLGQAGKLLREGKTKEAEAALDKAIALPELQGEQVQDAQFLKATCHVSHEEFQKGLDCFQKALEAAPDGPKAGIIKVMVRRCERALKEQTPKDEKPKVEEPKAQEPKVEKPSVEKPVGGQPKAEAPK